jgi:hypothetical protein
MIKKGHSLLKNTLSKLESDWFINLTIVLFIDRTIVYKSIKYTLFYIIYKQKPILFIESRFLI